MHVLSGSIPWRSKSTVSSPAPSYERRREVLFVSLSGDGTVSVVDYGKAQEMMRTPVGKFLQRSRLGSMPESAVHLLSPAAG